MGVGGNNSTDRNNPGNRTGKKTGERKTDVGRQLYIGFFLSD